MDNDTRRYDLLTLLLSLKALLEDNKPEKAIELIKNVISEIERED